MKLLGNYQLRKKQVILGLFTAWQLLVTLIAFAPLVVAAPAGAQKPATCFMRVECLDLNTKGNCDKQHCFEPRKECPDGQGLCYANPPAVPLVIAIGGKNQVVDLSDYIAIIFNFGAIAAGTVATVMFMIGGFQYLTAGGVDDVVKGKKRIVDALVGMALVLGSVLMLRTVNPDILKLQMPKIEIVKKKLFVGCNLFEMKAKCGDPFVIVQIPGSKESDPIEKQFQLGTADDLRQKKGIICRGLSCGLAGYDDGTFRCKRDRTSADQPTETPTQCGGPPAKPYMCSPCAGWGGDCSQQGKSDDCCTGFCGTRSTALATKDVATTAATGVVGGAVATVGKGLCTNGETGVNCGGNGECKSGRCETRGFHTCSSGLTGAACDDARQCASGYACPQVTGLFICTPKVAGSYCLQDSDCGDGFFCPRFNCGTAQDLNDALGQTQQGLSQRAKDAIAAAQKDYDDSKAACSVANDQCNADVKAGKNSSSLLDNLQASQGLYRSCANAALVCAKVAIKLASLLETKKNFGIASAVVGGAQSATKAIAETTNCGRCRPRAQPNDCNSDTDCVTLGQKGRCVTTDLGIKACTTGEDGSPCMKSSDCDEGFCVAAVTASVLNGGHPGICTKGLPGERCGQASECKNNHCYVDDGISATREFLKGIGSWGETKYGFCVTGQAGSGCNPDHQNQDCEDGLTCSPQSHTCIVGKNAC